MACGKKKASHNHAPPPPPPLHKFCTYCQMDREAWSVNRTVGNNKEHHDRNETLDEMVNIFELVIPQHLCIDSRYLDC